MRLISAVSGVQVPAPAPILVRRGCGSERFAPDIPRLPHPMSTLSGRVRRAIARRGLLDDGDRVAVAVSGGPDSVALAWILRALEPEANWRVAGLIHVNHGLRGEESDADEAFCRALARRMGLQIEVLSVDIR